VTRGGGVGIRATRCVAFMVVCSITAAMLLWAPQQVASGPVRPTVASPQAEVRAVASGPADPLQPPQVAASLRALRSLIGQLPVTTRAGHAARQRATAALHTLLAASALWPAQSPLDYREHLAKTVHALNGAMKRGGNVPFDRVVEALADDLEIKLEHSRLSAGRLGPSVMVRVRALTATEARPDVEVFYVPVLLFELGRTQGSPFSQMSDGVTPPTLVPGRYLIWLRDPITNATGEVTSVKVGEGRRELRLDLLVPIGDRPGPVRPSPRAPAGSRGAARPPAHGLR